MAGRPSPTMNPIVAEALREALAFAQGGDLPRARARAEAALAPSGNDSALQAFLGMICSQTGDFAAAGRHLRAASNAHPDDDTIAANLATALIRTGGFDEVIETLTEERAGRDPSLRLWRLRGYALQQAEDHEGAARAYRRIVEAAPDDWESWNNLGNALAGSGRYDEAIDAQSRAAHLAPDSGPVQLNLAASLSNAGRTEAAVDVLRRYALLRPDDATALGQLAALLRHLYRDDEAMEVLQRAVVADQHDASLRVQLGEELMAAFRFEEAETVLREALAITPGDGNAHVQLALLFEHVNREDELPALLAAAEEAGIDPASASLIRALVARRERRFEDGLSALRSLPEDLQPIRRFQLEGQFRDRLGDSEDAFAAFAEMNRLFKLDGSEPERRAANNRAALRTESAVVTRSWFESWSELPPPDSPSPVFLVGFPRSGTTLLDTMLMGHRDVQLLEERPSLRAVAQRLGGIERLPDLDAEAAAELRSLYFAEVAKWVSPRPGALLVDKSPLHMNSVPLIHRLFPDARFILALRHPCDVVLSCFITSFRLNDSMANFLDIGTTAEYYDLSFGHWTNCTATMPVAVHAVRYEDVVEQPEPELRRLLDFLDLEWQPGVLDHRATARSRGVISTASYAQVTEGLYRRAAGRWQRYRTELESVLPVLRPWAERFDYQI